MTSVPTTSTPRKPATPTSVYKYYDQAGILLYVGITSRSTRRQQEHNADKEWWQYVSRQEVEHYPSRPHAESREKGLIRSHCPPFNKRHNPHWEEVRAAYLTTKSAHRARGPLLAELVSKKRISAGKTMALDVVGYNDRLVRLKTKESDRWRSQVIDPVARRESTIVESGGLKMSIVFAGHADGDLHIIAEAKRGKICGPISATMKLRVEQDAVTIKHLTVRMPSSWKGQRNG